MDANRSRSKCRWTNEKHLRFLKSVEASFVRKMMENGDGCFLPMDRSLPDSCESTAESKTAAGINRRKRHFPADNLVAGKGIGKTVRRLRLSSQDDQVVPHMEPLKNEDNDQNWTSSP